jgi:3-hydroxyisobutyrate dehydrogenase
MFKQLARATRAFGTNNRVGVFGLGNMGLPMALNLQKNGYEVKGYDVSPAGLERAAAAGIKVSDCYKSTAQDVDYIVTALPVTAHVDETLHREGGIFEVANKGTYICDASTISPDASVRFGTKAKEVGMTFLDTPMSGGINGAKAGTLTFMVGGTEADKDAVTPLLKGMGKNIFHCGPSGTGGVAKLTNNLILGISMVATAEAMAIGEKLGADPKVLTNIWAVSTARCHSVDAYSPRPDVLPNVPSSNNYDGGFAVALIRKDLGLAMDAAKVANAEYGLTQNAFDYYAEIEKQGYAKKDFSIVYQYLMNHNDMAQSGIKKPE